MMLVPCPVCGPRHADEFGYVGEVAARPDPAETTAPEWRDYLYLRRNQADWTVERWYHRMGCRRYFVVKRLTVTNECRPVR
ncbi:MAG: sarcosine oxidase subunit delta [Actinomycetota bacterium]|nr:sarcosine oxidase subunit delta [Actinomycetota bacterium]